MLTSSIHPAPFQFLIQDQRPMPPSSMPPDLLEQRSSELHGLLDLQICQRFTAMPPPLRVDVWIKDRDVEPHNTILRMQVYQNRSLFSSKTIAIPSAPVRPHSTASIHGVASSRSATTAAELHHQPQPECSPVPSITSRSPLPHCGGLGGESKCKGHCKQG